MNDDFMSVNKGDPITAALWNKMAQSADASKLLLGGENTRVNISPHGTHIHSKFVGGWTHPWRVNASITYASIEPGTVNGIMAQIKGVRLDQRPPPLLEIDTGSYDSSGNAWIAIVLTMDKANTSIEKVEVKQVPNLTTAESTGISNPQLYIGYVGIGRESRYPIARMERIPSAPGEDNGYRLWQVAMFNLQHKAKPPTQTSPGGVGSQLTRHFYWPV
jgi:hypothetical protein